MKSLFVSPSWSDFQRAVFSVQHVNEYKRSIVLKHRLLKTKRENAINQKLKQHPPKCNNRKLKQVFFQFELDEIEYTTQDCVELMNNKFGRICDIFDSNDNQKWILTVKYSKHPNDHQQLILHPQTYRLYSILDVCYKIDIYDNDQDFNNIEGLHPNYVNLNIHIITMDHNQFQKRIQIDIKCKFNRKE